jgi:uncharacterized membrane protein YhiD involved in acid resistance
MSNATTFGFGLAAGLALTREGLLPLLLVLVVMAVTSAMVRVVGSPGAAAQPTASEWQEAPELAVAQTEE